MNLLNKLASLQGVEVASYIEKGIRLEEVQVSRKKRTLTYQLVLDKPLGKEDREETLSGLRTLLGSLFKDYQAQFKIEENFSPPEDLVGEVKKIILAYSPSASSWMDSLDIQIQKTQVDLAISDYSLYFSLSNNGLKDRIEKDLGAYGNYQVAFSCLDTHKDLGSGEARANFCEKLDQDEEGLCSDFSKMTPPKKETKQVAVQEEEKDYAYGKGTFKESTPLNQIMSPSRVTVEVDIFDINIFVPKDPKKKLVVKLSCTDRKTSILAKAFVKPEDIGDFTSHFKKGTHVLILGRYDFDDFDKTHCLSVSKMAPSPKVILMDGAQEKRIEFHLHTNMSNMDGVNGAKDFIARAAAWGHEALAITDHNVVQAFPEAMEAGEKAGLKIIYGLEADMVDDQKKIIKNYDPHKTYSSYVVFDVETTGFSPINNQLIEIGAVKIKDGVLVDSFGEFINPGVPIPEKITDLTGISDAMVLGADNVDQVMDRFLDFCQDSVLVAHNADFDMGFISNNLPPGREDLVFPSVDTLLLAQCLVEDTKNYRLGTLAKKFGIKLTDAHRAVYDAKATGELFLVLLDLAQKEGYPSLEAINQLSHPQAEKLFPTHVTVYAKDQEGLFDLYKLVSKSHMETFYRTARIKRSDLVAKRDHLILGSACLEGELFDGLVRGRDPESLRKLASFYDFLEVQPPILYKELLKSGLALDEDQIQTFIKAICQLGDHLGIPVLATGDVHYLDPEDEIFHKIIHGAKNFASDSPKEGAYFRTTKDMLEAFAFLGWEKAHELVVEAPRALNEKIETLRAIPKEKCPPKIKNADQDLRQSVMDKARALYGDPLPELVAKRLDKELDSIIKNGYAVMYRISQALVKKSNEDGYYVGSRGSVGSSLVATMSDITEVNPLPPHYICPHCQYSEFVENPLHSSGIDLPDKVCPSCGTPLIKEGHTIPFEVFLGFYGDKEPDIDLNFAGEYQSRAHQFIEDTFGHDFVFRAGTIGTMAEKTAYGHVAKYCEKNNLHLPNVEINRLVAGCVGVKRTSGQHPGGIMIVPKDRDIHDFTPIQYPADKKESQVITTHFAYEAIAENILKLDILGHDAPSILKMLEDATGVSMDQINLNDPETMSLFLSDEALKADPEIFSEEVGTLGIPEFGTPFVQKMLQETRPTTFSELVNISGLSHGTDVWVGNAKDLVNSGQASLSEAICTREDIMNYLIQAGADNKMAFDVMEKVRKGKGIPEKYMDQLTQLTLPPWYLDSCSKIKYMFPKAHAVAYVTTSVRIAWYKVHYPQAFYAAFFTTKLTDFDGQLIYEGLEAVKERMETIDSLGDGASPKDKAERLVFQVVLEMYGRGYSFLPVDLYQSKDSKFTVEEGKVRMPLQALVGVGENVAGRIYEEAKKGPFLSIEDMTQRTEASKTVIQALERHGCLDNFPKENQLSLFDFN
ncbi:MAG: PolC-type DNA polymerase III [Tissierellia bacterium]|nr:PolC-type DNA polymerase III [Tissierellia bacterium]